MGAALSATGGTGGPKDLVRLPPGGEICALEIDADQTVLSASPNCRGLFERPVEDLLRQPASSLLDGLSGLTSAPEGAFDAFALRGARPCHVRVFWTREGSRAHLLVVNLERLLNPFALRGQQARIGSLVTHDLRNPLSSIKMVVQTLSRSPADERVARRLSIAAREVRAMERSLNALSELTRLAHAEPEAVNLLEAARVAAADCEAELADRQCRLELDLPPTIPAASAQPGLVRRAAANLLAEAIRSNPEQPLKLSAGAAGDEVWLEISPGPAFSSREMGLCLTLVEAILISSGGRLEIGGPGAACRAVLPAHR